jgi:hypothetical protein
MKNKLTEYFNEAILKPVYLCAHLLNPRSKDQELSSNTLLRAGITNQADWQNIFLQEARRFIPTSEEVEDTTNPDPITQPEEDGPRSFISAPKKKRTLDEELVAYLAEPREPGNRDPLVYWNEHAGKFPLLSLMAHVFLSVPACSTPSKRAFSAGGRVLTKRRHSLKSDTFEALVCLKTWYKVLTTVALFFSIFFFSIPF